jgi:autotransporter-associated beta strand protein
MIMLAWQLTATAQNGTWTEATGNGTWGSIANWNSGAGPIAGGAGNTADFSMVDISSAAVNSTFPGFARSGIDLDTNRTIGNLILGDAVPASPGGWEVYSSAVTPAVLTLAGGTPTIDVSPLGVVDTNTLPSPPATPEIIDDAAIRIGLAGTSGFTKTGTGILTLDGANTGLTGTINVNEGTLRTTAGATFDYETAVTPERTQIALAGGATIEAGGSLGQNAAGGPGITVAAGATATITKLGTGSLFFANVSGAGSTLNFNAAGGTSSLDRDWAAAGSLAAINFTGTGGTPASIRMRFQGGTFNTNSFEQTAVNLDNVILFNNGFSNPNTNTLGSLSGTSTGELRGAGSGSLTAYQIGALNTDTTYAGSITTGNGLSLFKVGMGTLELSGTLSYQPTTNGTLNRRGGITRVEAGTLKLTGPAAIPGGFFDAVAGDIIATVDVRAGATLDVSGTTTPYSTAAFQQVIGTGTIAGNYVHDEGTLAPGDTNVGGNTQTRTAAPGTLTFGNNLGFAGSGAISFNMDSTPAGANDLIQVNGTADLAGSPTFTPVFANGIPAAGQTYTLVNANGGFGASTPASWVVQWPGRGAAPSAVVAGNNVQITTTAIISHSLNWSGLTDANWNTSTQNWYNNTTSGNDSYVEFDNVTFADTYNGGSPTPVANTAVNLAGVVNPGTVTVNSTTTNYSIAGTGIIGGNASLVKQGASTLTLTTANTYTGGTTISGGIIDFGATGSAGLGTITLSGGQIQRISGTTANNIIVTASTTNVFRNLGGDDGAGGRTTTGTPISGAISGSGTLQFFNDAALADTTPVIEAIDVSGDNSGFTGSVAFTGPSPIAFRFATELSGGDNVAWDLGSNGTQVGKVIGADATFHLGSLSGGAGSAPGAQTATLRGQYSGGGEGAATYVIGALDTSTTYDGLIEDGQDGGIGGGRPGNITNITKVGSGSLTLTFPNTYTGTTSVEGGTLSISNAYLADTADVLISTGAKFDLQTGVSDDIRYLYLDGVPQSPGSYGLSALGSSFFLGTGTLNVLMLGPVLGVTGDYNNDGIVNAADYTVWRNNLGGDASALTHRDSANMGPVSSADYDSWKAHFGETAGAGAGGLAGNAAVPEPASAMLVVFGIGMLAAAGSRRRS